MRRSGSLAKALSACALVTALVAGCGSADKTLTSPLPATTEPTATASTGGGAGVQSPSARALKVQVRAYLQGFLNNQPNQVFALLSQRCQVSIGRTQLTALVTLTGETYGEMKPSSITVQSLTPTKALLSYVMPATVLSRTDQHWIYNQGWKFNEC